MLRDTIVLGIDTAKLDCAKDSWIFDVAGVSAPSVKVNEESRRWAKDIRYIMRRIAVNLSF